jgi:hypothetical protein
MSYLFIKNLFQREMFVLFSKKIKNWKKTHFWCFFRFFIANPGSRAVGGGRPLPAGFGGARMRSTICPPAGGGAILPGVEEGQEEEEEEDENDVTVVESEQVGQIALFSLKILDTDISFSLNVKGYHNFKL